MKATIKADGTLRVTPESEIEAFALRKWIQAEPPEVLQVAWNDLQRTTQSEDQP